MMFSLLELLNLIIATAVVGYIFSGIIKIEKENGLVLNKRFDWEKFKFAVLVAAPGIILHELAHKFTAIGFGLQAVFELFPLGLAIGIILKLIGSSFILLAPGYVSILGASNLQSSLTALAGPLINGILWLTGYLVVKHLNNLSRKSALFWIYTQEINKWLFIFNLLPIPPLDGYKVFGWLFF